MASSPFGRKPARGTTIFQGGLLGGRGERPLLPLRVRAVIGHPRREKRATTHAARRVHQKKYWYRRFKRTFGL